MCNYQAIPSNRLSVILVPVESFLFSEQILDSFFNIFGLGFWVLPNTELGPALLDVILQLLKPFKKPFVCELLFSDDQVISEADDLFQFRGQLFLSFLAVLIWRQFLSSFCRPIFQQDLAIQASALFKILPFLQARSYFCP
jgi:hypothetical protein